MAPLSLTNQNIAILDLGSNLTKLVIVKNLLPLEVIHRSVYDTKTLKSAPKGYFDENSITKIEKDIKQILSVTSKLNCGIHLGIATSAFRTRTNGQEVIDLINQKFNINIQIIEGKREAQLIHKGALASVTPNRYPVMVMDIGGGSTEFIIGTDTEILWKQSFNFGSTALTKDLDIANPLTLDNITELTNRLGNFLSPLFTAIGKLQPKTAIGTTGAFESFAQLIENKTGSNTPVKSGYEYQLDSLTVILIALINSTESQRKVMDGMNLLRVGTINIAAVIFNYVFTKTEFENYYLSLGDVKEGLALEHLENTN